MNPIQHRKKARQCTCNNQNEYSDDIPRKKNERVIEYVDRLTKGEGRGLEMMHDGQFLGRTDDQPCTPQLYRFLHRLRVGMVHEYFGVVNRDDIGASNPLERQTPLCLDR